MIRNKHLWLATLVTTFTTGLSAQTLDLSLNNSAVNLDYSAQIGESALNLGAGILHHEDNGDVYYGSLFVADNINKQSNLLAGIGGRLYYIDEEEAGLNGTAVGIGGFINWEITAIPNLSLRSDIYYAPDVLAFDELSRYFDFSARIQYRIIEQAWVYIGYRNAEVKPDVGGTDYEIDESAHFGLMLWF